MSATKFMLIENLQEYLIICVVKKVKNKASGTSAYDLL